jgi:hypothetical protein
MTLHIQQPQCFFFFYFYVFFFFYYGASAYFWAVASLLPGFSNSEVFMR